MLHLTSQALTVLGYFFGGLLILIALGIFQFLVRNKHKAERNAFFGRFKRTKKNEFYQPVARRIQESWAHDYTRPLMQIDIRDTDAFVNSLLVKGHRANLKALGMTALEQKLVGKPEISDTEVETQVFPRIPPQRPSREDDTNILPKYHDPSETQIILPDWSTTNGPR